MEFFFMYYTYILESIQDYRRHYVGWTTNVGRRLIVHNQGKCVHTAKHAPWKVRVYMGFECEQLARDFEKYLKSGSGRAFSRRHF